jgi:hypothetical protein
MKSLEFCDNHEFWKISEVYCIYICRAAGNNVALKAVNSRYRSCITLAHLGFHFKK